MVIEKYNGEMIITTNKGRMNWALYKFLEKHKLLKFLKIIEYLK